MSLMDWPPKRLSWEVSFAPAIAMSRYENGGLDTHIATLEFAESFVRKYDFCAFSNNEIIKFL